MVGLLPIVLSVMDATGSGRGVKPNKKVLKDLLKATTTSKKIEVMEKYFKDAKVGNDNNLGLAFDNLKHYNKVFKKYNSEMERKGLKKELNQVRKELYKKYKTQLYKTQL